MGGKALEAGFSAEKAMDVDDEQCPAVLARDFDGMEGRS